MIATAKAGKTSLFRVPSRTSYPAKFSKALIGRIIDHGLAKGYWHRGSVIGDPFGGIGLGGIACGYRGLQWVGCELEPRFVALAEQNFSKHKWKLEYMKYPVPRIVQGDSRNFSENVDAIVSSPPYAGTGLGYDKNGLIVDGKPLHRPYMNGGNEYGEQSGQIGNLKSGSVDGVISSPPYATIASGAGGLNTKPAKEGQQGGRSAETASQNTDQRYGESDGQIARLKEGSVDSCITSPPFSAPNMQPCIGQGVRKDLVAQGKSPENNYGATEGQIALLKPETYWEAMRNVYASCFTAIKPNGVFACVVKDYVSKGKRVPLCDDTLRLLEHVGFMPMERIHAMLVKETEVPGFNGEVFIERKERKSFFRRLAEKKGSPRIDFEQVLFVRKH